MSKRDLVKKLDRLAMRAKIQQTGPLRIIDATDFNWDAFRLADAGTRAHLRQAYIDQVTELAAKPIEGSDSEEVREILVTVYVPGPGEEWRYLEADDD
jgi:hypothetical protein